MERFPILSSWPGTESLASLSSWLDCDNNNIAATETTIKLLHPCASIQNFFYLYTCIPNFLTKISENFIQNSNQLSKRFFQALTLGTAAFNAILQTFFEKRNYFFIISRSGFRISQRWYWLYCKTDRKSATVLLLLVLLADLNNFNCILTHWRSGRKELLHG